MEAPQGRLSVCGSRHSSEPCGEAIEGGAGARDDGALMAAEIKLLHQPAKSRCLTLLEDAYELDMREIVIVGTTLDGRPYLTHSIADRFRVIGMLERLKFRLLREVEEKNSEL